MSRTSTVLSIVFLVVTGGLLYATRLGEVPVYLMHDEAQGALQAHAIATTGRDLSGRVLPLYFTEPEFPPGRDPALIYVTALGLKLLPFDEAAVRTPTALVAVLNVVLTFLVARRMFQSTAMGLVAAGMLLLTPIHFIRGRLLLSPLYSIPFVLAWLWSLARFEEERTPRRLVVAALWLGLGAYSYLAAVVMMPIYLAVTLAIGYRRLGVSAALKAAAAFVATLIPMILWYVTHPERNAQIISAYQLDAGTESPLTRWIGLYWSFFDPSFLFVSGDASLINSTREAGFFPMAFAMLLPIGLYGVVRSRQPVPLAMAIGFVTAPLVSMISGAIEMNRVMFAIPFGVLVAASGVHTMLRARAVAIRAAAVLLLLAMGWQFAGFYSGYFGGYGRSAAPWLAGNAREALRALMAQAESMRGPIYISQEIDWVHRTWRFYAIADGRMDMIDRASYYLERPPADAPPGAMLICPAASGRCQALQQNGWMETATVPSLDGSRAFTLLTLPERVAAGRQ
jgi:4-amino-4-deoxy-L-arabinose transferase-like glycosyltransferase